MREERTIIERDLDDPNLETLREVQRKIKDVSDLRKDFWQNILVTKDIDKDISELHSGEPILALLSKELEIDQALLKEVFGGIDYDDLSNLKNISLVKKLFTTLKIKVRNFNFHSAEQIDYSSQFKTEITGIKYKLQKRFQAFAYHELKDKDIPSKESFASLLNDYEIASFTEHYDINEELDANKEKCFDLAFQHEPFKKMNLTYTTPAGTGRATH